MNTVVLSADYGYINQLETAIKSLIYHNHNLKIYVFNFDIPQEWFFKMNSDYESIGITVTDIKVDPNLLDKPVSREHINTMTYARLLIPDLISEDRVLYLDSDLVVNGDISKLFTIDMQGYKLGAVPDFTAPQNFNAGVLLIDNKKLREEDGLSKRWLDEANAGSASDDQTILNNSFSDHYLHLPETYNVAIGLESGIYYYDSKSFASFKKHLKAAEPFKMVHYETNDKPWNTTSSGELRDLWWQYFALEPEEIINHKPLIDYKPASDGNVFIFTYSQNIKNIRELVTALPNVTFHIAAYTYMGSMLNELLQYPNIRLYPNVIGPNLDKIKDHLDVYLDINYSMKDSDILDDIKKRNLPILSFKEVADNNSNYANYQVFDDNDISGMVKRIKNIIGL